MKNKERGYLNIDFGAVCFLGLILGGIVFISASELLQFFWPHAKAWLHSITA